MDHGSGDVTWPDDAVEIGMVVDAYGVKGWIKVLPHAADPQALLASQRWFLKPAEPARPGPAVPPSVQVLAARAHRDVVVAGVSGVADRAAAESLRGSRVFVSRANFPAVAAGEHYWVDLIGLQVVNRHGDLLGEVEGLIDTGPHSVLRVRGPAPEAIERLIPFVAAYVDDVDTAQRRIRVDWGLDY